MRELLREVRPGDMLAPDRAQGRASTPSGVERVVAARDNIERFVHARHSKPPGAPSAKIVIFVVRRRGNAAASRGMPDLAALISVCEDVPVEPEAIAGGFPRQGSRRRCWHTSRPCRTGR